MENDHNEEKKFHQDMQKYPHSTQNEEESFDDIINAANNLTEVDYVDFQLSEETFDNLSNLGVHDDEEEKEEDDNDNTVQQQESLQEKIFVLEKKIKEAVLLLF